MISTAGEAAADSSSEMASELVKLLEARQILLLDAEELDKAWSEKIPLPQELRTVLCEDLRSFVAKFIGMDSEQQDGGMAAAKPRINLQRFNELDILTTRVCEAIATVTSPEEWPEFGLKEAHASRRQWHGFVERCWEYATKNCLVEAGKSPTEYFQMKAFITKQPTSRKSTQHNANAGASSALRSVSGASFSAKPSVSSATTPEWWQGDTRREVSTGEVAPGECLESRLAVAPQKGAQVNPPQVTPPGLDLVPEVTGPETEKAENGSVSQQSAVLPGAIPVGSQRDMPAPSNR
jgi:hypothetical protein